LQILLHNLYHASYGVKAWTYARKTRGHPKAIISVLGCLHGKVFMIQCGKVRWFYLEKTEMEKKQGEYIEKMVKHLPVLRASLRITQRD